MPTQVFAYGAHPDRWTWAKRIAFVVWAMAWWYFLLAAWGDPQPSARGEHAILTIVSAANAGVYYGGGVVWLIRRTFKRGTRRAGLAWAVWLLLIICGPVSLWIAGLICRPAPEIAADGPKGLSP